MQDFCHLAVGLHTTLLSGFLNSGNFSQVPSQHPSCRSSGSRKFVQPRNFGQDIGTYSEAAMYSSYRGSSTFHLPGKPVALLWALESIVGYRGVQRPVRLGSFAFQVLIRMIISVSHEELAVADERCRDKAQQGRAAEPT